MIERFTIYIVGDFKSGAADGLAEFNYQNVKLLEDHFHFEFIEFDSSESSKHYSLETREEICVHRFGTKGILPLLLPVSFSKWLGNVAKQSLFHLSHIWSIRNYVIAKKLVRYNIHYLITPHDSYVYSTEYNKGRSIFKRLYRAGFVQIFDKYVLDHAQVVHAITEHCVSSLRLVTSTPIMVVENQVKDTLSSVSKHVIKPQVCFIGRFNIFQKGIDLALEAFAGFRQNGKNPEVRFVLVGPFDIHARKSAEVICDRLGLSIGEDVIFTGKVTESERNLILQESKVYMQLSRHEGFGLSVGQALSYYKPAIVSAGIPIGRKIEIHGAGYITESVQEATEALNTIFSMPEVSYLAMAKNARNCYQQEFHPDVIKRKLVNLYQLANKRESQ